LPAFNNSLHDSVGSAMLQEDFCYFIILARLECDGYDLPLLPVF